MIHYTTIEDYAPDFSTKCSQNRCDGGLGKNFLVARSNCLEPRLETFLRESQKLGIGGLTN